MHLQIANARVSFADQLYTPKAFEEGQDKKYGADFIVEPDSVVYIITKNPDGSVKSRVKTTLKEAELTVANEAWPGRGAEMLSDLESSKKSIRNGNKRTNKDGEIYEGYEGRWYVTAKSSSRPALYGSRGETITEEDGVIYSGCRVHVSFDLYANTKPKTRGVFAGLTGARFARDDESFGGGGKKAAAEEFAGLDEGSDEPDLV